MRVLILDDDFNRHQAFRKIHMREPGAGDVVVSVQKYSDFLHELTQSGGDSDRWDMIYLDHDLGDHVSGANTYVNGFGQTIAYDGCSAVFQIIRLEIKVGSIVIQSHNSVCAPNMVKDLRRFGYVAEWLPFGEVSL